MSSSIPQPPRTAYRRCRTPTIVQLEAAECGAAVLCMIVQYYGRQVPLEEARELCGTSRDGVSILNISQAAESYGLKTEGFQCELEDLYQAPLPLIAYWGFNHFVVIEGFSKKYVYINDPATGPRTISYEELNQSFTGVILTLAPTEAFQPMKTASPVWKNIKERLNLFRKPILFCILLGLLAIVPTLALTALSQIFIDDILIARLHSWEFGFILAIIAMVITATAIQFLQSRALANFSVQLSTLLSTQFIWRILRLPLLFFMQRYGGEVASRMSLNEAVSETFVQEALSAVISLCFAFIFAIVMFYYDVPIALIGISIVLINLFTMIHLYRSRANAYANYRENQGFLASYALGGLENIEALKSVGGEYQFLSRYGGIYARSLNTLQIMGRADLILGTLSPFFSHLGYASVLMFGAWRIIQGHLTIGEFFALQILFKNFTDPVLSLVNLNQTLQLLTINTERLNDVLLHPEDPLLKQDQNASLHNTFQGNLEVKDLSFGYNRLEAPLLEDICLTLTPGSFTALIGPSGCGKSTLIRLIGSLLQPWQGEILIDGTPRSDYPKDLLTRRLSFVEQTSMLFDDSIDHNLSLIDPLIPHQNLIQAAQDACIHDEIMQRPGGYQSLIEKQGVNFSGGQRQRLEIACALARNPSLLILDEATSAVDAIHEKQIIENIRKRQCTCMMITHRLSAIADCDLILVMNQGRIVQRGKHQELMQQEGLYRDLVQVEQHRNQS